MDKSNRRHRKRGIIMLSTLVALVLVISLIVLTQSLAVSNIKTLKRLARAEQQDMLEDSLRELARPLIADAMLGFREERALKLDSTPYPVTFHGQSARIIVQDVNGLVDVTKTPAKVIERLLPVDLASVVINMKNDGQPHMPLRQRFVLAGGDLTKYPHIERWVTSNAKALNINTSNLPGHYNSDLDRLTLTGGTRQPQGVVFSVEFD